MPLENTENYDATSQDPEPANPTGYTRGAGDLPPGMAGMDGVAGAGLDSDVEDPERILKAKRQREAWLIQRAQTIFSNSTSYMESNITNTWSKNIAFFRGEHAPGSAMRGQSFKRSRVFRPKTRTNVKTQESALATALFSTQDLLATEALNPKNPRAVASAAVQKELLQYRLSTSIPWFMTAVGAYQDTKVYGVCISHQYWNYAEDEEMSAAKNEDGTPVMGDDGNGNQVPMGTATKKVLVDQPCIDLVAPENFRFDPMSDWRNPAKTSPYLIYMVPMFAGDVLEMMERTDRKTGQPTWRPYDIGTILTSRQRSFDRTRQAREGQTRVDPSQSQLDGVYTTVWAHLNIVRIKGEDIAYWTLGTDHLLSDPVRLEEMYPHLRKGERPFQIGYSSVETHRNYPAGDVEQGAGLQEEINKIANQRLDNVELVLNKRYFVRRGSMTDLDALIRNTPGGGVMMNDPEKDVKVVSTNEVTGSSYQEQDRLAGEFDGLVGNFSPGAPQNNEKQGQALGLAKMGGQSAGAIQDYSIRIFIETWLDPVLRQLQRLEAMYETDEVVLALAADKADALIKYGIDQVTDDLLEQDLVVGVNVGIGNTDPTTRVNKLVFGITQAVSVPGMASRIRADEVVNEIFGSLGYRDGSRFFMSEQELAKSQEGKQPEIPPEIQVKMKELDIRNKDNEMRDKREQAKLQADIELGYANLAMQKGIKLEALYTQLGIAKQKDKTHRDVAALTAINKHGDQQVKRLQVMQPKPVSKSTPPSK